MLMLSFFEVFLTSSSDSLLKLFLFTSSFLFSVSANSSFLGFGKRSSFVRFTEAV